MITKAGAAFSHASMIVPDQHVDGWKAVQQILQANTLDISHIQFVTTVGNAQLANQLLATNVFAHHHPSDHVSMQSATHVQYARAFGNINNFKKNNQVIDM